MKTILTIPIILSIFTASMFIGTLSDNEKVYAFCKENNNKNIYCHEEHNNHSNTATTTTSTTTTNPATIEEEANEEESIPMYCIDLSCSLSDNLLGSSMDSISSPLDNLDLN
jgi:hypothetical protein